jgi:hypothetical protein
MFWARLGRCLLFAALLALGASSADARNIRWLGPGGWGPQGEYGRLYDPRTVETVRGRVAAVDTFTPLNAMANGVRLRLETDAGVLYVHLGPQWFLDHQEVRVAPRDSVEIAGSRITFRGRPALLAATVTRGDQKLRLRDEQGWPIWSAWRKR